MATNDTENWKTEVEMLKNRLKTQINSRNQNILNTMLTELGDTKHQKHLNLNEMYNNTQVDKIPNINST